MSIVLTSTSGPDSKLHLEIPVGQPGQEFEVTASVRPLKKARTQEEWQAWVERTAGAWQGEFERPEPLPPEERDSF